MRNFTIQLAMKTFKEDLKPVWNCGTNISKIRWRHWRRRWNAWKPTRVDIWFHRLSLSSFCLRDGVQHRWCENFAQDAGRALLGRGPAFSGPMGFCWFAHNSQRLECSGEVRAARRALFLPHQEGAVRSHRGWAVRKDGKSQAGFVLDMVGRAILTGNAHQPLRF